MPDQIPVRDATGPKWADVTWVVPPGHGVATGLTEWRAVGDSLKERDAVELGRMAAMKWRLTAEWGTIVSSSEELRANITAMPDAEVTGMLTASAAWFPGRYLGVCLFHRTWQNNLFLDFLAAHPATQRVGSEVAGVGIGLMFRLAEVAQAIDAELIWGETTALSGPYYQKIFQQAQPSDRLYVTKTELQEFSDTIRQKLSQWPIP